LKSPFSFKYRMMMPAALTLVIIIILPLLYSIYVSMHEYILQFGLGRFVGLHNYLAAFTQKGFVTSITNTFVLTFAVVIIEFIVAFSLALLLDRKTLKARNFYTVILMLPIMMPPICVGLIWRLLLHPDLGVVNFVLKSIGLQALGWYGDASTAMLTVILVDVWHETSLLLILILSGLTSLDHTQFEAAQVDGASFFQTLWHVTIPLLAPVLTVAAIIRTVSAVKVYDLIYILTAGGPGSRTETMSYYIYKMAFRKMDMGSAAAESFLLLIVIMIFVYLLFISTRMGRNRAE
jgi:multiple sugar transport system permease protein